MSEAVKGWIFDEFIAPGARLTQGDLIKFEEEKDPLKKAGIVVTADCDLDKKKHARLVTLIPVVSVTEIMENYLFLEDCETKREQIEQFAFKSFSIGKDNDSDVKKIMLSEKLSGLGPENKTAATLAGLFATEKLDRITIKEYHTLMDGIKNPKKKSSSIAQQIRARGDILVLPDLKITGIEGNLGNLAWVRHIWQVSVSEIAIKTSDVVKARGEKVARLDSPFRYRLTQLLAQVFSDIGLPDIRDTIEREIEAAYGQG